jgi:hypothetical protein
MRYSVGLGCSFLASYGGLVAALASGIFRLLAPVLFSEWLDPR